MLLTKISQAWANSTIPTSNSFSPNKAFKKIRRAVKKRQLPEKTVTFVLDDAVNLNIITAQEADQIRAAEKGTLMRMRFRWMHLPTTSI